MLHIKSDKGYLLLEALFVLTLLTLIVFIHIPLIQTYQSKQVEINQKISLQRKFYDYVLTHESAEYFTYQTYHIRLDWDHHDHYSKVSGQYLNQDNKEEVLTVYYVPKQPWLFND